MLILLVRGVGMGGSATASTISTRKQRRIQPIIRCRKKKHGKK